MLGQSAHLLAPTDPPHSLTDILYSRVSHDPDWGPQAQALAAGRKQPALISEWPLPDLPAPPCAASSTGHTGEVTRWRSPRTAPGSPPRGDGRCGSGTLPPASSAPSSPATPRSVKAVAVAPDGTWLATASYDDTVRIWDPATGQQRAVLTGHTAG